MSSTEDHIDVETFMSGDTIGFIEAEEEESEDRITIEDTNITTEMSTSQLAIQEQHKQDVTENIPAENVLAHGYNLRKRLTRHKKSESMTQK